MQLGEVAEYSVRRGWTVIAEYVDAGISGARRSGPSWTGSWPMLTAESLMQS